MNVGRFGDWLLERLHIGLVAEWVWHPESPGTRVLVIRGFWGRWFKPADFATLREVAAYYCMCQGFTAREPKRYPRYTLD